MHHEALPGTARITQRDTFFRIEDPVTGLCIQLHCAPAEGQAAPRIIPRLTPARLSTWFVSRPQAEEAFVRYLGAAPYEIVRADA